MTQSYAQAIVRLLAKYWSRRGQRCSIVLFYCFGNKCATPTAKKMPLPIGGVFPAKNIPASDEKRRHDRADNKTGQPNPRQAAKG